MVTGVIDGAGVMVTAVTLCGVVRLALGGVTKVTLGDVSKVTSGEISKETLGEVTKVIFGDASTGDELRDVARGSSIKASSQISWSLTVSEDGSCILFLLLLRSRLLRELLRC